VSSTTRSRSLADLSCDELCYVLEAAHFGRDLEVFRKYDISGRQFSLCTDADLNELGINFVVKRKDALNLAEKWKNEGVPVELFRNVSTPAKVPSHFIFMKFMIIVVVIVSVSSSSSSSFHCCCYCCLKGCIESSSQ
jgi:hypothetical protein